jgi:molecular chaperone HscB
MTDYFEIYQLPVSFHPVPVLVKAKYYELSRAWHPDRFVQASEQQQAEALRMAALNNDAYKTLSNPDRLMAYILKLNNLLEDEEKYNLPPAFLMEMMDLNETVSEYETEVQSGKPVTGAEQGVADYLNDWQSEISPLIQQYDNGDRTQQLLLQIKDYYFRKKYLLRVKERIDKFAAR